jgi:hypothetical protein
MNGEWIPVKRKKLPKNAEQEVLVVIELNGNGCIGLATYDDREEEDERWIGADSLETIAGTVTHWMPEPALPRRAK